MASASAGKKLNLLLCSICEEHYNEKDRLPKGFPCQHSVCMKCLQGMIALCDGDEVACPLCRQAAPIPQSSAAGFPNNVVILDLLANVQPPTEEAPSTCSQHNKVISVFCSTCQEAICVTCMFKSLKHKGHDMEELSEAMEKCIEQSQEVQHDISQTCSQIQENTNQIKENIAQKAKANNSECLKLLQQLQKHQVDLAKTASLVGTTDIPAKPYIPQPSKISVQKQVERASPQVPDVQVDGLLATNLPQSVNRDILELLASAKLPKLLHIDMNRRNNLLLTFPQEKYALYKINNKKFCKTLQPTLPEESIKMLEQSTNVVLSHDNKIVIPGETGMMYDNKTYSFHGKLFVEVKVFHEDWFLYTYYGADILRCVLFAIDQRGMAKQIKFGSDYTGYYEEVTGNLQILVVPSDGCYGVAIINISDETELKLYEYSVEHSAREKNHCTKCCEYGYRCLGDKGSWILRPNPLNVTSAAVMKKVLFLLENGKTIAVYSMEDPYRYDKTKRVSVDANNRMSEIHLQDLGLTTDCELQKIWAGDTERRTYILHVLYTRTGHGNALASYSVDEKFLANCKMDK